MKKSIVISSIKVLMTALTVQITFFNPLKFSFAFNDDYQTMDATPPPQEETYDIRFILNSPYSGCEEEGIPIENCRDIGFLWGGDILAHIAVEDFLYKNTLVKYSDLEQHLKHYTVVPFKSYPQAEKINAWQIPTEGQITWMIENNLIPRLTSKDSYFYTSAISDDKSIPNTIGLATPGSDLVETVTNPNKEAYVFRLVTPDAPSICSGGVCDLFRSPLAISIRNIDKICDTFNVKYSISFQELDGSRTSIHDESSQFFADHTYLPLGAKNVNLEATIREGYVIRRDDIITKDYQTYTSITVKPEDTFTFYKLACYEISGTCAEHEIIQHNCIG